ncbi:helix-turn-helix domain-containing protein [Solirubrobacter ginsenosidimutans]|uniref:Helix-turn-helix domain-containing protein n=1 Tax=Solirubrobacter ginsenosidimutans TaxID=490573 RepID=A0A9X3MV06_9ACTN|nr:helix-turn-helix transcriptional regulator [Solirubrobacter ginsenosidimutans]MDA0161812.1 helix-turn-helix domain-containing protein [Solirubrobacter ginsenosidimutans]
MRATQQINNALLLDRQRADIVIRRKGEEVDGKETLELAGLRLREERERNGLTLDEAARELGLAHRSQLSRIERGERSLDSVVLRRAASLYGVAMEAFFTRPQTNGLVVKARRDDANVPAADEMARWGLRKLDEWRFVKREVDHRGL